MLQDLQPTTDLGDSLENCLDKLIHDTDRFITDGSKIDMAEYNDFVANFDSNGIEIQTSVRLDDGVAAPWNWTYEDGNVVLKIRNCQKDDVIIDENSIKSTSISGKWWCEISNINVENIDEQNVQIAFKASKKMPVLISSFDDDTDPLSIFYLSILFLFIDDPKMFIELATKAAKRGQFDAIVFLWKYFQSDENEIKIHWLAVASRQYNDCQSENILAQALLSPNSPIQNIPLAEHLLIKILQTHSFESDVILLLGKLYLLDSPYKNTEKGLNLFEYAAQMFEVPEAIEYIQKAKQSHFLSNISAVDIAIISSLLAVGIGAAIYIFSRRRSR